jgi:hypothetical protein
MGMPWGAPHAQNMNTSPFWVAHTPTSQSKKIYNKFSSLILKLEAAVSTIDIRTMSFWHIGGNQRITCPTICTFNDTLQAKDLVNAL